jgi:hypothetical protein
MADSSQESHIEERLLAVWLSSVQLAGRYGLGFTFQVSQSTPPIFPASDTTDLHSFQEAVSGCPLKITITFTIPATP